MLDLRRDLLDLDACRLPLGHWHWACNPNSGFSADLDTTVLSDGEHTLQITAVDTEGWATVYPISIVVDNSCTGVPPPIVSITSPANNATVSGTVQVTATASSPSPVGILKVNFTLDGSFASTDQTNPYTFSWNTATVNDGTHTLRGRAFDNCGRNTLSPPVTVTVANAPPTDPPQVNIDWPLNNQTVSGTSIVIDGWAVDESGVTGLTFFLDEMPLTLNGPYNWHSRTDICNSPISQGDPRCPNVGWRGFFNSTAVNDGSHSVKVVASDGGATAQSVRTIIINNYPAGTTVSFSPTHDTYVEQDAPTATYGSRDQISVRHTTTGQGRYNFLKFNIAGITGPITSAKLLLTESYGRDIPQLLIWEVFNNSWSESTLTWNNIPTPYELRSIVYNLSRSTTHEINVSDIVDGNGEVTVGLSTHTDLDLFFGSKEHWIASMRPTLRVTYQP